MPKRGIKVRGPDGAEHVVHSVDVQDQIPVTGERRTLVRFELENGQQVRHIDDDTFILVSTGETLTRVG